jgi:DNA-binding CsgD family transcriptional regulator
LEAGSSQGAVAHSGAQEADRGGGGQAPGGGRWRWHWQGLAGPNRRAHPAPARPLSAREAQIAGLVAQGSTNPQIAARLHLCRRTVENHLEHIFTKLGVENRTELADWFLALREPPPWRRRTRLSAD